MVRTPSSWVTRSGRPDNSLTASEGRSSDASTATVPPMRRTFSSVTSSRLSAVGTSTVHRVIALLLGENILTSTNHDISCSGKVKMYRVCLGRGQLFVGVGGPDTIAVFAIRPAHADIGGTGGRPPGRKLSYLFLFSILLRWRPRPGRRRFPGAPARRRADSPPSRTPG